MTFAIITKFGLKQFKLTKMKKLIAFIKSLVNGFTGSLDHNQQGFSQKKIIGYSFVLFILFIHLCLWRYQFRFGNFTNLDYVLGADITALGGCIGVNFAHETAIMKNSQTGTTVTDNKDTTQLNS